MPEAVETEEVHFLQSLIGRPVLESHAIRRDENAGAIIAEPAVDKDFLMPVLEERKKLCDLFVGGRRPAAGFDIHEAHAERFRLFALALNQILIVAAKIHDGGDAELLELLDSLGMGLGAAKQGIVNFSGVVDARKF